jgi:hypothetical protein
MSNLSRKKILLSGLSLAALAAFFKWGIYRKKENRKVFNAGW